MSESSASTKSTKASKTTTEEPLQTLPAGHPQAGYVAPDLSFQDGVAADEGHDELVQAQQDQAEAVAKHEDAVAKEEAAAAEKEAEAQARAAANA